MASVDLISFHNLLEWKLSLMRKWKSNIYVGPIFAFLIETVTRYVLAYIVGPIIRVS